MEKKFFMLLAIFQVFLIIIVVFTVDGIITFATAQTTAETFEYYNSPTATALSLSAGITVSAAVLGSAIAIKTVGTAAISSLSEQENFFQGFFSRCFMRSFSRIRVNCCDSVVDKNTFATLKF